MVIAGRQFVQPGQALAYISRNTLDSTNRANQDHTYARGDDDRLVGISDKRADPEGLRVAKMTGYVPARSGRLRRRVGSSESGNQCPPTSRVSEDTVEEELEATQELDPLGPLSPRSRHCRPATVSTRPIIRTRGSKDETRSASKEGIKRTRHQGQGATCTLPHKMRGTSPAGTSGIRC